MEKQILSERRNKVDKNWKDLWEYHYSENLKYVPRWPDNFAIKFFGRISKSVVLRGKKY